MATFQLKYNANGGSSAPATQSKITTATQWTFTISSTEPTRTGYSFRGWGTSSGASSASYSPGDTITLTRPVDQDTYSVTLYAVWRLRTYTVGYSANGGTGAPGSQTKTYGVALTLSGTAPTRSGYTFQGWATSASGGVEYSPGGSYTDNAAVTLYAIWAEIVVTTYTVSYNANGGTGAPGSQTKEKNITLTLSSTVPTRVGYDFLGWGTSAGATTPSYQPGGAYSANATVTLYAVWSGAVTPTGAMYRSDGVGITEGEPYIVDDTLLAGTAYIVLGGILREGK